MLGQGLPCARDAGENPEQAGLSRPGEPLAPWRSSTHKCPGDVGSPVRSSGSEEALLTSDSLGGDWRGAEVSQVGRTAGQAAMEPCSPRTKPGPYARAGESTAALVSSRRRHNPASLGWSVGSVQHLQERPPEGSGALAHTRPAWALSVGDLGWQDQQDRRGGARHPYLW